MNAQSASSDSVIDRSGPCGVPNYIVHNTVDNKYFQCQSYVWTLLPIANGVVLTGQVAPPNESGNNGDIYINTTTGDLYGPKATGSWGAAWGSVTGGGATVSNSQIRSALSSSGQVTYDPTTGVFGIPAVEPAITAGSSNQYFRGDKTFQTLNSTSIGLGNVENIALTTWPGNTNITTLGTITTGHFPWSLLTSVPSTFTPSIHATTHASNGSDPISPTIIGAESTSNKNVANGYAGLDSGGKVPYTNISNAPVFNSYDTRLRTTQTNKGASCTGNTSCTLASIAQATASAVITSGSVVATIVSGGGGYPSKVSDND